VFIKTIAGGFMHRILSTLLVFSSLSTTAFAGDFKVHEWGTFTSFMGSNGELIEGMHHEDEPLPSFVYGLKKEASQPTQPTPPRPRPCRPNSKVGCETLLNLISTHSELFPEAPFSAGVTQKMETPVIYFYGDNGKKVNVEINFPEGIHTQYFPASSYTYPKLADARELSNGRLIFDITLLDAKDTIGMLATPANSIWNPARQVPAANVIRVNNEKEKFIFYRGIGNFNSPLKVTSDDQDVLKLESNSVSPITHAIVLNSNGQVGNFTLVENIVKPQRVNVPNLQNGLPFASYIEQTKANITEFLVKNGLYRDEALAMVNTWEKSYFHTPGIRVLYVVPNEDTDNILPLTIKPAPNDLVRVLIGRVEVMTKNQESAYLKVLASEQTIDKTQMFGRFYEPKLRRLEQIAPTEVKAKIKSLL
jgi:hypothetical protein